MINLPVEMTRERVNLRARHMPAGHWYHVADVDEIDFDKVVGDMYGAFDPHDPAHEVTHVLFRYPCSDGWIRWLCLPNEPEPDITAEDLAEWCASSAGTTCNAYCGRPWFD